MVALPRREGMGGNVGSNEAREDRARAGSGLKYDRGSKRRRRRRVNTAAAVTAKLNLFHSPLLLLLHLDPSFPSFFPSSIRPPPATIPHSLAVVGFSFFAKTRSSVREVAVAAVARARCLIISSLSRQSRKSIEKSRRTVACLGGSDGLFTVFVDPNSNL